VRPPSNKRLAKILVKKIHNLIGSTNFVFEDGSTVQCGGSDGAVLKHCVLAADEYITRVYFRQSKSALLGVQFETNTGRQECYLLLEHHAWQVKDGYMTHHHDDSSSSAGNCNSSSSAGNCNCNCNWVYTAAEGRMVVGYNVASAGGEEGRHATAGE
jgi:hypothetical protein